MVIRSSEVEVLFGLGCTILCRYIRFWCECGQGECGVGRVRLNTHLYPLKFIYVISWNQNNFRTQKLVCSARSHTALSMLVTVFCITWCVGKGSHHAFSSDFFCFLSEPPPNHPFGSSFFLSPPPNHLISLNSCESFCLSKSHGILMACSNTIRVTAKGGQSAKDMAHRRLAILRLLRM